MQDLSLYLRILLSCMCQCVCVLLLTYAAPQRSPLDFLNVTVSRTHQNRGLVIQWDPTPLPPPPGTVFAYYQVQYRMVGEEGDGEASMVGAEQSWIYIDMLENAHNFEVSSYNSPLLLVFLITIG